MSASGEPVAGSGTAAAPIAISPPGSDRSTSIPAETDPGVDHVWANVRIFLPGRRLTSAVQLGGDRLEPHLARFANDVGGSAPEGGFDLVAVEDLGRAGGAAADVLREALRLCGPAGTVLVGYRPWRLGLGVRRMLRDRSRDVMTALPSTRRPAFLLDPRHRRTATYFVRRMAFAYRAPGSSGVRAQVRALASGAARALPSRVAIHASPARIAAISGPDASLLTQLQGFVRSSWSTLDMPGRAPDRLEPLVIGHRRPDTGMVTVLLFPSGGGVPVVAKFPRYGTSDPALQREDVALRRVADAIEGPLRQQIPRSLGVHRLEEVEVGLQTGMSGRHLVAQIATGRLRPQRVASHLDLVLSWCRSLQAASGELRSVDDELIASRIEPLASAALAALDDDPHVAALLDRTLEDARALRGTPIPMVVAHGDFWAGNILVEDDLVTGVVDWERATVDDLPLWDPVKAVGSAAYHLDRYRTMPRRGGGALPAWGDLGAWDRIAEPRFATGFRAAFVQPSWLTEAAEGALVRTFDQSGIPRGWLPVAMTFYLVRQIVQAGDAPRSVAGWGSVLRALAVQPDTWTDTYRAHPRPHRPSAGAPTPQQEGPTP